MAIKNKHVEEVNLKLNFTFWLTATNKESSFLTVSLLTYNTVSLLFEPCQVSRSIVSKININTLF